MKHTQFAISPFQFLNYLSANCLKTGRIFLTVLALSVNLNLQAQVSGTFTVGGTSPDFATLDSAFNYLEIRGVNGKVRLNVRAGTHTLRTTISSISGASQTNTIRVAPDPSNTGPVVFTNLNNSSSTNYLLRIAQSYLSFDSLNFTLNPNSAFGNIVVFTANSAYVNFNSSNFIGKDTTSNSTNYAIIYTAVKNVSNSKIINCNFKYGSYSLCLNGRSINYEISGNTLEDYYYMGAYFYELDYLVYSDNYCIDNGLLSTSFGIYLNVCKHFNVNSNQIYNNGYQGTAVFISQSDGTLNSPSLLHTNFISGINASTAGKFDGIRLERSSYVGVYFNTVVNRNISGNSRAISIDNFNYLKGIRLRNNIFYSTNGFAISYENQIPGVESSDCNLLYSGGDYLVRSVNPIGSLLEYKERTTLDSHSMSVNLNFNGSLDLHTLSIDIYKKGAPIQGITKDIDGRNRKINTPDIGAHEQLLPSLDLAIKDIPIIICEGNSDVFVKLRNEGLNPIDSCIIDWEFSSDGNTYSSLPSVQYRGQLVNSKDTLLRLGAFNFNRLNKYYFRVKLIKPNGKNDSLVYNDQYTKLLSGGLKGVYTIGDSSSDFLTIESAFLWLSNFGVCGPVRLTIKPGTYNEQITVRNIPRANTTQFVKLVPDPNYNGQIVIRNNSLNSSSNWVIRFLNASHVHIDSLNIHAINNTFGNVITFEGHNYNITLSNDSLKTTFVNGNNFESKLIVNKNISYFRNRKIRIQNCDLLNGFISIDLNQENSLKKLNDSLIIKRNSIRGFSYSGIYISNHYYTQLNGNYLFDNKTHINPIGINLFNETSCITDKNVVNIYGSTGSPKGIVVSACIQSDSFPVLVCNNIVEINNPDLLGSPQGIAILNGDRNLVLYNFVRVNGGDTNSKAIYVTTSGTNPIEIYNNVFYCRGKGFAAFFISSGKYVKSDYNNYFTQSPNFTYYNSINSNINQLKLQSGFDVNSISTDPFHGKDRINKFPYRYNGKAKSIKKIKDDFYGVSRDSISPDIGPFEFDLHMKDPMLEKLITDSIPKNCGVENANVYAVLYNNGLNVTDTIFIKTEINGSNINSFFQLDTFYNLAGTDKKDTLKLKGINTSRGGKFNITSYIINKNGNFENDTCIGQTQPFGSTPDRPADRTDTICDNQLLKLTADMQPNSFLKWYKTKTGGSPFAVTDTLEINGLPKDTTLYVSASYPSTIPGKLRTNGNGNGAECAENGVMFDLKVLEDLYLDSFSGLFPNNTSQMVYIYHKNGSYRSYESNQSAWTLIDSVSARAVSSSVPGIIRLNTPLSLNKNTVHGFYLDYYAKYSYTGNYDSVSNNEIKIVSGSILCKPFILWGTGRHFTGEVFYSKKSTCESARASYKFKVDKSPVFALNKDTSYCASEGILLKQTLPPGYKSYLWMDGDTSTVRTLDTAGVYSVRIENDLCFTDDFIEITEDANPVINLGEDKHYCENKTFSLLLDPGPNFIAYKWLNGSTAKNVKVTDTGTYGVKVTDNKGCTDTDTIRIFRELNPRVRLGKDTSYCVNQGISMTLDAGSGFSSYLWSDNDTTKSKVINSNGQYSVSVTNKFGCTGGDTIKITALNNPDVKLPDDTSFCSLPGFIYIVNAGSGYVNYQWSNNQNSQLLFVNKGGLYSVEVTAANGCKDSDSIVVSEIKPDLNLGMDTGYCIGQSFALELDAGASYPFYRWNNGSTGRKLNVSKKGEYSVMIKDQKGCEAYDTIQITEEYINLNIGNDTFYCSNNGINLELDAGGNYKSYQWKSGEITRKINVLSAGKYSVVVKTQFGCIGQDSMEVNELQNPDVNLGPDRLLNPAVAVNEILDAGSGYSFYLWNTGDTISSILVKDTGIYHVLVTNTGACEKRDTIKLKFWDQVQISNPSDEVISVFPVPADKYFDIVNSDEGNIKIKVYHLNGKLIYNDEWENLSMRVNCSEWTQGLYIVVINKNGDISSQIISVLH